MIKITQNKIRQYLSQKDAIPETIDGIVLIEKRDKEQDSKKGLQCATWFYREHKKTGEMPLRWMEEYVTYFYIPENYSEVETPEIGDIVLYLEDKDRLAEQLHMGEYKGNNKVLSKWDFRIVYEHELELVPLGYGDRILFFREN